MATTPLSIDERVSSLEARMEDLEDRMDALNSKIDVATDAIRGDIRLVLERVDSLGAEMQREFATVRQEHRAGQRLIFSILKDHNMRLRVLERSARPSRKGGSAATERDK